MASTFLDAAGHRRSPATLPGYHVGRPPRNKGLRYPADPPTIDEIVAVMRATDERPDGLRLRALIVILWRAGLRISEALALAETDLDPRRGAVIVRRGKGGKRREIGMDRWAWEQLEPMAHDPKHAAGRWAVLRDPRTNCRTAVGGISSPQTTASHSRSGWGPTALRATPTAPRPRRRDGARGSAAGRDPTPTRSRQPRNHIHLPPRHRQLRDHQYGPLQARTRDLSHSRPQPHPITGNTRVAQTRTTRQPRRPRKARPMLVPQRYSLASQSGCAVRRCLGCPPVNTQASAVAEVR